MNHVHHDKVTDSIFKNFFLRVEKKNKEEWFG